MGALLSIGSWGWPSLVAKPRVKRSQCVPQSSLQQNVAGWLIFFTFGRTGLTGF